MKYVKITKIIIAFFLRFRPLEQEDTGFLVYSSESGEIRQLEYPETAEESALQSGIKTEGQWLGVFDGIGGLPDGEVASLIAASSLAEAKGDWTSENEAEYEDQLRETVWPTEQRHAQLAQVA